MTQTLPSGGSKRWLPKPHQKKAVQWMIERGAAGLFLDPGLGKTSITLAAISLLLEQKLARGLLVIAPLRPAHLTWPGEIAKWADFRHLRHVVLHGKDKNKALRSGAHVYIINPEGLRWLFRAIGGNPDRWPFDILTVDESSKFKNTRTLRFKELREQLPKFRRRYILTGSPTPNGLTDLFGQIYLLDLGAALGRYITHYRMMYFNPGGFGGYDWFLKPGADKQIYSRISPLVLRMDAKDWINLPPKIETDVIVELPAEARRAYNEVESKFTIELAEGSVTAVNAAAATVKLRQVANGGAYLDVVRGTRRGTVHLHDEKTEALVELLEELEGQPTLVAYEFDHDVARILPALKKAGFGDVPNVSRVKNTAELIKLEQEWNAGKLSVMLGHPLTVAHGLNLQQGGRAVIWYALTWDLELYQQYVHRIWRQGQEHPVFVYRIIAKDTIDEVMIAALHRKDKGQRALLNALRGKYIK